MLHLPPWVGQWQKIPAISCVLPSLFGVYKGRNQLTLVWGDLESSCVPGASVEPSISVSNNLLQNSPETLEYTTPRGQDFS